MATNPDIRPSEPHGAELRAAQQTIKFFENLLRATADGILITDTAQNIIRTNDAFCALLGRDTREIIETNLFVWLNELSAAAPRRWTELEQRVSSEKIVRGFELTARHKTLSVTASILEEVTDITSRSIISIWHDVTHMKDLAKFPSENPYPVLRIAKDGTMLFANSAALQLLDNGDVGQAAPGFWKKLSADVLRSAVVRKNIEIEREDKILSFTAVPVSDADYVNLYGLDVTERKLSEQALSSSTEQRINILASISDAFVAIDNEWRFTFVNGKAEEIIDQKADDIMGRNLWKIFPDAAKTIAHPKLHKAMEEQVPVDYELFYEPFNAWLGVRAYPFANGLSIYFSDVTERKEAEEALGRSHGLLQAIIEESTDPIFAKDVQGRYLLANSATAASLGKSRSEMIGSTDREVNPADLADRLIEVDQRVMKTEKLEAVEEIVGDSVYVSKKWPLRDNEGNVIGTVGVSRDVTKDKQIQAQIRDLAKFPSENPFPVLRIAKDGTVLYVNAAAQPLLDGGDVGQAAPSFWKKLSADVLKSGKVKKNVEIEREDRILGFTAVPISEGDYINLYGLDVTERKQAEQITRQSLSDTEALRRLSARSTQTLELDEVLDTALSEISNILGVQHGCIYIFDQAGNLVIQKQQQLTRQFLEAKSTVSARDGCAGQAVATKEVYAPTREKHDFTCEDSKRLLDLDCMAAIPIISKGNVLGVVELFAPVHKRLSARERRIVRTMADQLGSAIENANLYSKERNIANTLQETLLTVPEKIEGISFGNLYRSATAETARAGGDFYDLFELKHGKLGIVIGDVSGKGLAAASLTSLVKNTVKAYAYQHASPAKVIALTNDVIVDTSTPSSFVTLFFGILDKESGVLLYCNAGHPHPIIRKPASAISLLKTGASVIGVFSDLECQDFEETLRDNDILFLYTDGAIEARRDHELFGEERLVTLIKDLDSTGARELPGRVFKKLFDFAEGTMADDTALLAISLENGAMTRDKVLGVLAEGLIKTLDIAGVAIMLIDPQMEHIHGALGEPANDWPDIKKVAVSLDEPVSLIDALKSKSPVVVDNAEKDPRAIKWLVRNYQCKSAAYFPIFADQKVFGVAIGAESRRFRHFSEDQVEQAQLLASKAARQLSDLDPMG